MGTFNVGSDDRHWIITLEGTEADSLQHWSRMLVEEVRYQAHPMSGFGNVGAYRRFVGDDEMSIKQLNQLLGVLDETQDALKVSEQKHKDTKEEVGRAAQDLKNTRSHKRELIGRQLKNIRERLENLAEIS